MTFLWQKTANSSDFKGLVTDTHLSADRATLASRFTQILIKLLEVQRNKRSVCDLTVETYLKILTR